jgi:hypothetical protein
MLNNPSSMQHNPKGPTTKMVAFLVDVVVVVMVGK